MPVKVDARLEGMAGYSWSIDKKEPRKLYLIFAILALLAGLSNSLSFWGIGNKGNPIITFYSRMDDISPGSYEIIAKNIPGELEVVSDRLKIDILLRKSNYPDDFFKHYLYKLPFDLAYGIFLILFYFQQLFFSKNESKKVKIFSNLGIIFSIALILYRTHLVSRAILE